MVVKLIKEFTDPHTTKELYIAIEKKLHKSTDSHAHTSQYTGTHNAGANHTARDMSLISYPVKNEIIVSRVNMQFLPLMSLYGN